MGKKYKIFQQGQFLGHHSGHSPADAAAKAIDKYGSYYNIDIDDCFDVQYGFEKSRVCVGEK